MEVARLLRAKISSSEADLNVLHATYDWIPDSNAIRPAPHLFEQKLRALEDIERKWMSLKDYILYSVFDYPIKEICGRFYTPDVDTPPSAPAFRMNDYPYAIKQGNHWILWYPTAEKLYSDEQITADIERSLTDHLGAQQGFDFAWYENPKMSVQEFYHVQVFWILL